MAFQLITRKGPSWAIIYGQWSVDDYGADECLKCILDGLENLTPEDIQYIKSHSDGKKESLMVMYYKEDEGKPQRLDE